MRARASTTEKFSTAPSGNRPDSLVYGHSLTVVKSIIAPKDKR
jgi:hypothetical protein